RRRTRHPRRLLGELGRIREDIRPRGLPGRLRPPHGRLPVRALKHAGEQGPAPRAARRRPLLTGMLLLAWISTGCALPFLPPAGPSIEIVSPKSGAIIDQTEIDVQVKVTGVELRKADDTHDAKTGHLHLFVDREPPATDEAIPAGNPKIIHSAQPTIHVTGLTPGVHTFYAVLGYGDHRPFRP